MSQERIRVGIIGASVNASWGPRTHVPAVQALDEFELAAICTAHPESATLSAGKFGARLAFSDHMEMVNHPEIDLVVVSLRVPKHYQVTMDALAAGKHVYTEWPLGVNLQEAEEMAKLAKAKGVRTRVGLQARVSPPFQRIKELVEEGFVGQLLACHLTHVGNGNFQGPSDLLWHYNREAGRNTMTVQFGHAIDIFRYCLGEFSELTAIVTTQVKQWYHTDTQRAVDVSSPDNIIVNGRLKNGAVASVNVSSVPYHPSGFRLEVYGSEGTLVVTDQQGPNNAQPTLFGAKMKEGELHALPLPKRLTWVPDQTPGGSIFNVAQLYRRMGEAIRADRGDQPDFATGVSLHQLLDTIQMASNDGQRQVL
jgi:predicted dehydrogenase